MFINCKHCGSLVATDPATDLPPERCPRCRGVLRSPAVAPQVSVASLLKMPTADVELAVVGTPGPAAPTPAPAALTIPAIDAAVPAEQAARLIDTPASPIEAQAEDIDASASAPADAPIDVAPGDDTAMSTANTLAAVPPASAPAPAPALKQIPVPESAPKPAPMRASPSFARRGASGPLDAHARRQHRILYGVVVALTLLLGLQVLLADRARLATDPGWRPTLARICGVLRCSLPPWYEPAALTVLARDVRPDAADPGQLLATATFRNDARWAQAWPRLRLTLSDVDGRAVGTRVFTAHEYLDTAPAQPTLAAGASAQAQLRLVEPDARAVSFAFDFL